MTRLMFAMDQSNPVQIHDNWTETFYDGTVRIVDGIAETDNPQYVEILILRGYQELVENVVEESQETTVESASTPKAAKATTPPRRTSSTK